jgi:hypothetical protein
VVSMLLLRVIFCVLQAVLLLLQLLEVCMLLKQCLAVWACCCCAPAAQSGCCSPQEGTTGLSHCILRFSGLLPGTAAFCQMSKICRLAKRVEAVSHQNKQRKWFVAGYKTLLRHVNAC